MAEDRDKLVSRVIDAQWCLRRELARRQPSPLLDLNLTMQQTKVLLVLSFHGAPLASQTLTRQLGVSLATLSGIVDRLVAQGLVDRREDPDDRRVRLIELTERGRRLVEDVRDAGLEQLRHLLDRLDDETLGAMELVLNRLREAAEQDAVTP
jgi:DNA-binding MarR family transcriptional regulator